jgi:hypothetical protein
MEASMNNRYGRTERLTADQRKLQRTVVWDAIVSIAGNIDLLVVTIVCLTGLLLTLVVTLAVPGFNEMTEVLQQLL